MTGLEQAAQDALRLNQILVISNILLLLEQAQDLEDAKQRIRDLLTLYAG